MAGPVPEAARRPTVEGCSTSGTARRPAGSLPPACCHWPAGTIWSYWACHAEAFPWRPRWLLSWEHPWTCSSYARSVCRAAREAALGAIAGGGIRVVNEDVRRHFGISDAMLDRLTALQSVELSRRELAYRGAEPWPELADRVVVLVDDGLATGASMRSAIEAVRTRRPARIVVAVPVAPPETCSALESMEVEVVADVHPERLLGGRRFYEDFTQTSDDEVRELRRQPGVASRRRGEKATARGAGHAADAGPESGLSGRRPSPGGVPGTKDAIDGARIRTWRKAV